MFHKNCPFCGGSPVLKTAQIGSRNETVYAYIMCQKCKMKTGGVKIATVWNGCDESHTTKIQDKEVYKDGRTEVFEGHYRDYEALTAELGSNPDVVSWTVDWES